jgi:molecular chaperone DnaK
MANVLEAELQKKGVQVVEACLRQVIGKPVSCATDEVQYRQAVVQPAWKALPPPLRQFLDHQYPRWDAFCLALRPGAFEVAGGRLALRPGASARIAALMQRQFGSAEPGHATPSAPPLALPVKRPPASTPPLATPADPPLASPVGAADTPVGIDLGTTLSVVAYLDAQGRPCSIPNASGDLLTPSVVLFDEGGSVVGKEAVLASALEPEKVAECVKRDMGGKVYRKKINGEYLPPEVVSSLILRSVKADAERRLGPVRRAVITVPAYFDERRRRATMDAGRLAGLEVLDIVNEPTAAAIAYGYQLGFLDQACRVAGDRPLRVLVFDIGGGTFDVTVVELREKSFKALATDGDVGLGGKDWDDKLVDIAAGRFRQQLREDPRDNPISLQELRLAAEAAKRTLTERPRASLFVHHLGSRLKVEITREEFEEATAALLERTRLTTEIVVRQTGLTWAAIDRVLLVGGSTRMPMVGRMLAELSGKELDRSVSVDEAVAHGAALYAGLLAPSPGGGAAPVEFTVTNVNSHSLGILGSDPKTGRKHNKVLLPKNMPLPRTVTKVFKTSKPDQRRVVITVLEGESDRPEACSQVGVCAIGTCRRACRPAGRFGSATPTRPTAGYTSPPRSRGTRSASPQTSSARTVCRTRNWRRGCAPSRARRARRAEPRTVAQQRCPAKVFDHAGRRSGRHVPPSAGVPAHPLPIICRAMMICYTTSRRRSRR